MSTAVDYFDRPLKIGDKVLYTTNSEGSPLAYGRIQDIYASKNQANRMKVSIQPLDNSGDTLYQDKYVGGYPAGDERNWIRNASVARKSIIEYYNKKIYLVEG